MKLLCFGLFAMLLCFSVVPSVESLSGHNQLARLRSTAQQRVDNQLDAEKKKKKKKRRRANDYAICPTVTMWNCAMCIRNLPELKKAANQAAIASQTFADCTHKGLPKNAKDVRLTQHTRYFDGPLCVAY